MALEGQTTFLRPSFLGMMATTVSQLSLLLRQYEWSCFSKTFWQEEHNEKPNLRNFL
jgi:hypothetical protein